MSISLPRKPLPLRKETDAVSGKTMAKTASPASVMSLQDLKDLLTKLQQEQNKIQELLSFLGYALRSFSNLNQFLELIPIIVSRVTDADGGALILFKASGQMRLESLHCNEIAHGHTQKVRGAIERAIEQVISGSPTALDEMVSRYLGSDMQLNGASILVKNSVRGRLYVFSSRADFVWNETRRRLLRLVADQTAVGIENNQLATELMHKERLDKELEIGAEIQRQLLPRTKPTIPSLDIASQCVPAGRVGGDYYDFIPMKNSGGKWGIVMGDVMGKGVPAGLIMTMTRGMLRAEVLNGHPPSLILEHLNAVMYEDLDHAHRFVTMFYAEYDPDDKLLTYSNAAHVPALLWRSHTNTVQVLDTLGALVGFEPHSRYEQRSCNLQAGDVLMLYTDGITEAPNSRGERFDEENLRQALKWSCQHYSTAQEILEHIIGQVQQFTGQPPQPNDDMTLLIIRVTS